MLLFTVSVAAMYEGEPIVGVIFEPATESMYAAVKEGEAQLNGRRINASEETINEFTSIGLDSHFEYEKDAMKWVSEIIHRSRFRNYGTTALQIAYVAKGGLIATIANTPKLWDIAAGAIIAEMAGAVTTDWQGQKIFPVDLAGYEGGKFKAIFANKNVHSQIVELLKS